MPSRGGGAGGFTDRGGNLGGRGEGGAARNWGGGNRWGGELAEHRSRGGVRGFTVQLHGRGDMQTTGEPSSVGRPCALTLVPSTDQAVGRGHGARGWLPCVAPKGSQVGGSSPPPPRQQPHRQDAAIGAHSWGGAPWLGVPPPPADSHGRVSTYITSQLGCSSILRSCGRWKSGLSGGGGCCLPSLPPSLLQPLPSSLSSWSPPPLPPLGSHHKVCHHPAGKTTTHPTWWHHLLWPRGGFATPPPCQRHQKEATQFPRGRQCFETLCLPRLGWPGVAFPVSRSPSSRFLLLKHTHAHALTPEAGNSHRAKGVPHFFFKENLQRRHSPLQVKQMAAPAHRNRLMPGKGHFSRG